MRARDDRILEYALQVHFGRFTQRDLSAEIERAWERGVRGSGLDDLLPLELEFEPAERELDLPERELALTERREQAPGDGARSRRWRRAAWLLLPLAAGLATVYFWLQTRQPEPAPGVVPAPGIVQGESGIHPGSQPGDTPLDPAIDGPIEQTGGRLSLDFTPLVAEESGLAEDLYRRMTWADITTVSSPITFEKLRAASQHAMATLADRLEIRPPLWDSVEPWMRATLADPYADDEMRRVVVDLCARERSRRAVDLAREFWALAPASFEVDHLVAFAETGAIEFERELEALIEDGVGFPGQSRVLAAAYFALRGDARGRAVLRAGLAEREFSRERVPLPYVAALALADLGETAVWDSAFDELAAELELLFQAGRDDLALEMVVAAEFFADSRTSGERPKLSEFGRRIWASVEDRKVDLPTREALRSAAEAIAGR